jgi:hypothetical protein
VCVAVFHFRAPFESISAPQAVRSLSPRRSHGTVASEAGRRTVSQIVAGGGAERGRRRGGSEGAKMALRREEKRQKSARGALFPRPTVNAFVHYQEMIDD